MERAVTAGVHAGSMLAGAQAGQRRPSRPLRLGLRCATVSRRDWHGFAEYAVEGPQ